MATIPECVSLTTPYGDVNISKLVGCGRTTGEGVAVKTWDDDDEDQGHANAQCVESLSVCHIITKALRILQPLCPLPSNPGCTC